MCEEDNAASVDSSAAELGWIGGSGLSFIYRLRALGVPVGLGETLLLARALAAGLHESSVDGFYYTARSILIHHEGHLDAFDAAFLAEFRGMQTALAQVKPELLEWLEQASRDIDRNQRNAAETESPQLSPAQIAELRRRFEERLREQTERHDGGNYWIGTAGTSPLGQAGRAAAGISTGSSGGGRSALRVADARNYRPYRSDLVLDIRQFEVALRRLRAFVREGAETELDLERTIDATAANAGEIEVVTRPPSRPNTHVILLIDVGGSMFPYSRLMSRLFSATRKATHFKELRTYFFHNCVYGQVYRTDKFADPIWIPNLLRECDGNYKLIVVGDALMAPYELTQGSPVGPGETERITGLDWLVRLRSHYQLSVWLNPEPESAWPATTIERIGAIFDMFPMTVDGLTAAMTRLNRGVVGQLG